MKQPKTLIAASGLIGWHLPYRLSIFFTPLPQNALKWLFSLTGTIHACFVTAAICGDFLPRSLSMKALKSVIATAALAALTAHVGMANAALVVNSSVGGAPTGTQKWNMDDPAPAGLTASFVADGGIVSGGSSGIYAAPFLSGGNGAGFGPGGTNQANGADTTLFGTTGSTSAPGTPGAKFTLMFSSLQQYFGLLWGSVDTYNTLTFLNGATNVGTLTGSQVMLNPTGNQGAFGTEYVNINSTLGFDTVVFTSSQFAFEFDNIAWSDKRQDVPEPGSLALLGLGLAGLAAVARRKQKQA